MLIEKLELQIISNYITLQYITIQMGLVANLIILIAYMYYFCNFTKMNIMTLRLIK